MASVLHRSLVLRAIRNARIDIGGGQKCFSTSMPALASKKKRAAQYDDADDLFSFSSKEDDLFVTETLSGSQSTGSSSSGAGKSARKPFEEEFAEHHAFVTARLGPNPTAKHPMVRQSALRRLLHLSQGREDLLKVVDLLVTWRDSGKSVDKDTSLQIIDRCLAWDPHLLVKILANRSKNGFTIPSLPEARRILHRLVLYRPREAAQSADPEVKRQGNAEALRKAATFAALMPASRLKLVTDDFVSCALLAQACARNLFLGATPSTEGKADASHVPDAQASIDGLKSLATTLASLLESSGVKEKLPLPTKDVVREWSSMYRNSGVKDCRARLNPLVHEDRESGVTQTGEVERAWAFEAVSDIIKALKIIEGLEVEAKVIQALQSVVDASEHSSLANFTPPRPWRFDERLRTLVLPDVLEA